MNVCHAIKFLHDDHYNNDAICYLIENLTGIEQVKSIFCQSMEHCNSNDASAIIKSFISRLKQNKTANLNNISSRLEEIVAQYSSDTLKLLLIKSYVDNKNFTSALNVANKEADDENKQYLTCAYLAFTEQYDKALLTYCKVMQNKDYPELLAALLRSMELTAKNKELAKKIISKITSRKNYNNYYHAINAYIKNLIVREEIAHVSDIDIYVSRDKISLFIMCELLFKNSQYQDLCDYIMQNLKKISSFYPICPWVIKSINICNTHDEILDALEKLPKKNKAHIQLKNCILEYQNKKSERLYRYSGNLCDNETYHVMFCTNASYFAGFRAALESLAINNSQIAECIKVHIFIDDSLDIHQVSSLMKSYNMHYKTYNMDDIQNTDGVKVEYGLSNDRILDKSAYYRIYALDYLIKTKEVSNKVLYLDSDILVMSNILKIFQEYNDCPVYGCLDNDQETLIKNSKRMNNISNYINSGVLLFNTTHQLFKTCLTFTIKAIDIPNNLMLHDQCAINIGFNHHTGILDRSLNYMLHMNNFNSDSDTDIIHFTGAFKPWHSEYYGSEILSKIWYTYYRLSNKRI